MRKSLVALFLALSILPALAGAADDDSASIQKWQKDREEALRKPYGWLSVSGMFPLKAGKNTVPITEGTIDFEVVGKQVFALPGSIQKERQELTAEKPLEILHYQFELKSNDQGISVRVRDSENPARQSFKGCKWYPIRPAFRVEATLTPPKGDEKTISIDDIAGGRFEEEVVGILTFQLEGKPYRLLALPQGEGLFIIFRDLTSGKGSYGAGRFLTLDKRPALGEKVELDFNRAYNPPCAISKFTTCPLPPKQNWLKAKIEAGEKY